MSRIRVSWIMIFGLLACQGLTVSGADDDLLLFDEDSEATQIRLSNSAKRDNNGAGSVRQPNDPPPKYTVDPIIVVTAPPINVESTSEPLPPIVLNASNAPNDPSTTDDPTGNKRAGNVKGSMHTLPNGQKISELGNDFQHYDGVDAYSKIVANNKTVYVLNAVQTKDTKMIYSPYTIGHVLSYLFEVAEFGPSGPPKGFTTILAGGKIPQKIQIKRSSKFRRASMIFKKKTNNNVENTYWKNVFSQ